MIPLTIDSIAFLFSCWFAAIALPAPRLITMNPSAFCIGPACKSTAGSVLAASSLADPTAKQQNVTIKGNAVRQP
uniref:Putative secreted protein n=1 Tax=Anopheles triannulatus TaxID=58253 RepID=A0A2M4B529_9DIPT